MGEMGEKIVKKFLEQKYQAIVTKKSDYAGYDFEVKIKNQKFAVEVKTTVHHLNQFYISYNELKTAEKLRENYYIYRLYICGNEKRLFVIKNPIALLEINQKLLGTIFENEKVSAKIDGLAIILKDEFIEKLPVVNVFP